MKQNNDNNYSDNIKMPLLLHYNLEFPSYHIKKPQLTFHLK